MKVYCENAGTVSRTVGQTGASLIVSKHIKKEINMVTLGMETSKLLAHPSKGHISQDTTTTPFPPPAHYIPVFPLDFKLAYVVFSSCVVYSHLSGKSE